MEILVKEVYMNGSSAMRLASNVLTQRIKFLQPLILSILAIMSTGLELRADQTITVRSGNGRPIGSQDSLVRVLGYGEGNVTPSASDFITVQTSPFAYVVG